MESPDGSGSDTKPQSQQLDKKRPNRAPSPARPFLKDAHCRSGKPPAAVPKSPKLGKQQSAAAPLSSAHPNRSSRRGAAGTKDKPATARSSAKSSLPKKPSKAPQHAAAEPKTPGVKADPPTITTTTSSPVLSKGRKGKASPGPLSHGSPIRVPTAAAAPLGRVSQTDSSSDLSDCLSEPPAAASSDAESGTGSSDRDRDRDRDRDQPARGGASQAARPAQGSHGEKRKAEKPPSAQLQPPGTRGATEEDLLREIEDLRSENDYLKVWMLPVATAFCPLEVYRPSVLPAAPEQKAVPTKPKQQPPPAAGTCIL